MKYRVNLEVTPEEVFEQLRIALVEDIQQATGRKFSVEQLHPGYTYKKQLKGQVGKARSVKVKVVGYKPSSHYSAEFHYGDTYNVVTYNLAPVNGGCEVYYEEKFKSNSLFQNLNYHVMSFIYKRSGKKRLKAKFEALKEEIQRNR